MALKFKGQKKTTSTINLDTKFNPNLPEVRIKDGSEETISALSVHLIQEIHKKGSYLYKCVPNDKMCTIGCILSTPKEKENEFPLSRCYF